MRYSAHRVGPVASGIADTLPSEAGGCLRLNLGAQLSSTPARRTRVQTRRAIRVRGPQLGPHVVSLGRRLVIGADRFEDREPPQRCALAGPTPSGLPAGKRAGLDADRFG